MSEQSYSSDSDARWESYSPYRDVSEEVSQSVFGAVESHSRLQSMHTQNHRVTTEFAVIVASNITSAARKLLTEVRREQDKAEIFKEAAETWPDYIDQLHQTQLTTECPEWLDEWTDQIHQVAWELGYIKAGREQETRTEITEELVVKAQDARDELREQRDTKQED